MAITPYKGHAPQANWLVRTAMALYRRWDRLPTHRTMLETAVLTYIALRILRHLCSLNKRRVQRWVFTLPFIRIIVARQMLPVQQKQAAKVEAIYSKTLTVHHLPDDPVPVETLVTFAEERADAMRNPVDNPCIVLSSGARYTSDPVIRDAQLAMLNSKKLDILYQTTLRVGTCPDVRKSETEVIQWISRQFLKGGDGCCGTLTPGGTHSIILAMETYHNLLPHKKDVILPESAHAAFARACARFGLNPVFVGVDEKGRADVDAMWSAISDQTLCIVGSAPNFPNGAVDPILELSQLALKEKVFFHVDCCLGSTVATCYEGGLINMEAMPGITTVSFDLHKYGGTAKGLEGASAMICRDRKIYAGSIEALGDSSVGVYGSPNSGGSRSAAALAVWAALLSKGKAHYDQMAEDVVNLRKRLQRVVEGFPTTLEIVGEPDLMVFAMRSADPDINIYELADLCKEFWRFDHIQKVAEAVHFCVTPHHLAMAEKAGGIEPLCAMLGAKLAAAIHQAKEGAKTGISVEGEAGTYKAAGKYPVWLVEQGIVDYWTSWQLLPDNEAPDFAKPKAVAASSSSATATDP